MEDLPLARRQWLGAGGGLLLGGMDSLLVGLRTEPLRPLRGHLPFQGRLLVWGQHTVFRAGNFLLHTLGLNSKAAPIVCHWECSLWLGFYQLFDAPAGEFILHHLSCGRLVPLLLRKEARVRLDAIQGSMLLAIPLLLPAKLSSFCLTMSQKRHDSMLL